jgi:GNAT superfamily N-acetyltransferase
MLNYDLVTSKACYRLPRRDDMPALLRLAAQYDAERAEAWGSQERMLRTTRELLRHPDRGSIFLIERGQNLVGYCILVNQWSNRYGGLVLKIDELFLDARHRRDGIAEDFLDLLVKVAPPGTFAIEFNAIGDKEIVRLCERAGFERRNGSVMTRRTAQEPAASDG